MLGEFQRILSGLWDPFYATLLRNAFHEKCSVKVAKAHPAIDKKLKFISIPGQCSFGTTGFLTSWVALARSAIRFNPIFGRRLPKSAA